MEGKYKIGDWVIVKYCGDICHGNVNKMELDNLGNKIKKLKIIKFNSHEHVMPNGEFEFCESDRWNSFISIDGDFYLFAGDKHIIGLYAESNINYEIY